MKAHYIGLFIAVVAACGAPQRAATTDPCVGDPGACPGVITTTGAVEKPAANKQNAQQANSPTRTQSGGAAAVTRSERNEEPTIRSSTTEPRTPPSNAERGFIRPVTPHPINTGDPCGPCQ